MKKPLPALDLAHPLVCELKTALRNLDAMPLSTKEEVAAWYQASQSFQRKLRSDWASFYDSLPHELEHYLVDADIRARDSGYAEYQRQQLVALLTPELPNQALEPTTMAVTPRAPSPTSK